MGVSHIYSLCARGCNLIFLAGVQIDSICGGYKQKYSFLLRNCTSIPFVGSGGTNKFPFVRGGNQVDSLCRDYKWISFVGGYKLIPFVAELEFDFPLWGVYNYIPFV